MSINLPTNTLQSWSEISGRYEEKLSLYSKIVTVNFTGHFRSIQPE